MNYQRPGQFSSWAEIISWILMNTAHELSELYCAWWAQLMSDHDYAHESIENVLHSTVFTFCSSPLIHSWSPQIKGNKIVWKLWFLHFKLKQPNQFVSSCTPAPCNLSSPSAWLSAHNHIWHWHGIQSGTNCPCSIVVIDIFDYCQENWERENSDLLSISSSID